MNDIRIENNVEKLNAYWRENTCYDLPVIDICHFRNRCVIALGDYLLLCEGVSDFDSTISSFPIRLFEPSLAWVAGRVKLTLTTYAGTCSVSCGKVRLYNRVLKTNLVD